VRATDPAGARLELRAPFTIGADGLRSRVARALGAWEPLRWLDRLALVARVPCAGLDEHAEVHFLRSGYVALAPTGPGMATLNLVVDRTDAPRGRAALPGFVAEHVAQAPELARRIALPRDPRELGVVGPLAARTRAQAFDGAALVGDAAGYVDPVTGEGMYLAMRGAALLAESLDAALRAGRTDAAALRGYERARRREFGHRRTLGLLLQRGLRHPRVVATVLSVLAARPALAELLLGLTGTAAKPGELLSPGRLLPALVRALPAQG
jgi:flavin-dependent dehydrogenase